MLSHLRRYLLFLVVGVSTVARFQGQTGSHADYEMVAYGALESLIERISKANYSPLRIALTFYRLDRPTPKSKGSNYVIIGNYDMQVAGKETSIYFPSSAIIIKYVNGTLSAADKKNAENIDDLDMLCNFPISQGMQPMAIQAYNHTLNVAAQACIILSLRLSPITRATSTFLARELTNLDGGIRLGIPVF